MRQLLLVVLAVAAVGCQCGNERLRPVLTEDAGPTVDAGVDDAGEIDAGEIDAGGEVDAGIPDAGAPDAGTPDSGIDDAGIPDAGEPDAGMDAGPDDAGVQDAGPEDAGVPDAGQIDAGCPSCVCTPGERRCLANVGQICADDGSAFVNDTGAVGCEFWSLILGWQLFGYLGGNSYGIAFANYGSSTASVTVEGGVLPGPLSITIPAGSTYVERLSDRAQFRPFHIVSSQPITATAFAPMDARGTSLPNYSCDASLLQPTHRWRKKYLVASWPQWDGISPSLAGIVTSEQPSQLTITPRVNAMAHPFLLPLDAGVATSFSVDAGSFIELRTTAGDLTGTIVESDQPIGMIGGHYSTKIPANVDAADHLEEGLIPIEQFSTEYFVIAPSVMSVPQGVQQMIRIMAGDDDVDLTYEPAQPGAPSHLTSIGDFIELGPSNASFRVLASKPVLISQFQLSQSSTGAGTGDPSMFIPPARSAFVMRAVFHAPPDYQFTSVDIVAPASASIVLDGVHVMGASPIGTTGYSVSRVTPLGLGPGIVGRHELRCSEPCMGSLAGFDQYTSYWVPLGG